MNHTTLNSNRMADAKNESEQKTKDVVSQPDTPESQLFPQHVNHTQLYTETNLDLWNKWTDIHINSEFYDVKGFIQGKSSLNKVELEALGDVRGKSILHLQCHFGLDSISWARKGAKVTGVDFADKSINFARKLTQELKSNGEDLDIKFVCSNIYSLPEQLQNEKFDIVFTSYGAINWLHDLDKWADVISHYLKPGGIFYIVDFHSLINMLDDDLSQVREKAYFSSTEPRKNEEHGSYVDPGIDFTHDSYDWYHPISEVLNSLRKSGLIYEQVEEFHHSPYNCFQGLVKEGDHYKTPSEVPLLFSIKAINYPELKK